MLIDAAVLNAATAFYQWINAIPDAVGYVTTGLVAVLTAAWCATVLRRNHWCRANAAGRIAFVIVILAGTYYVPHLANGLFAPQSVPTILMTAWPVLILWQGLFAMWLSSPPAAKRLNSPEVANEAQGVS